MDWDLALSGVVEAVHRFAWTQEATIDGSALHVRADRPGGSQECRAHGGALGADRHGYLLCLVAPHFHSWLARDKLSPYLVID